MVHTKTPILEPERASVIKTDQYQTYLVILSNSRVAYQFNYSLCSSASTCESPIYVPVGHVWRFDLKKHVILE